MLLAPLSCFWGIIMWWIIVRLSHVQSNDWCLSAVFFPPSGPGPLLWMRPQAQRPKLFSQDHRLHQLGGRKEKERETRSQSRAVQNRYTHMHAYVFIYTYVTCSFAPHACLSVAYRHGESDFRASIMYMIQMLDNAATVYLRVMYPWSFRNCISVLGGSQL